MVKMDQRAQISVEYILLVAIVLTIVLVFSLIITNENEQNNVATAAQLGAANASANIVLTNSSQSPIKVTSVSMTNGTTRGSDINVVIHFSRPVGDQDGTIFSSIIKSLTSSGFTNISSNSTTVIVTTSTTSGGTTHRYFITLA
jgi:uncharacterized protein (UPF0333 family)